MRIRFLLPLAAAAGAILFAMAPVNAQETDDYPPAEPLLSVSPVSVEVGGSVMLTGTGYAPNETVTISVEGTTALTVQADGDGAFTTTLTMNIVGQVTIAATGAESGLSASVVETVLPKKDGLPSTGNELGRLLWVGGATVGSGALLLLLGTLAWRRRQHRVDS